MSPVRLFMVALILASLAAPRAAAAPCGDPLSFRYIPIGTRQTDVIARDFDGDGNVDLVTITFFKDANNELRFLRGNGDGTFTLSADRVDLIGRGFGNAVTIDFNNDGLLDVAVLENISNIIALALNEGGGKFKTFGFLGGGFSRIRAADLNGDGLADLFFDGGTAYLGHGDGRFGILPTSLHISIGAFALGDLDRDGIVDLVAVFREPMLLWGRGLGDGKFGPTQFAEIREPGAEVAATDLDGDGDLDVIVAGERGSLYILVNNGANFIERGRYQSSFPLESTQQIVVFDQPEPRQTEIAVLSGSMDTLSLFTSNGDGTLTVGRRTTMSRPPDNPPSGFAQSVAAGDFDGDGDADFAIASSSTYLTVAIDPCKPAHSKRRAVVRH
jgi:VCBS repeat protein